MTTEMKSGDKPVRRKMVLNLDNRIEARPSDMVTVTIYPSGVIGFRANRSRHEYILPLESVYQLAVRKEVQAENPRKTRKVSRGLLSTFNMKR